MVVAFFLVSGTQHLTAAAAATPMTITPRTIATTSSTRTATTAPNAIAAIVFRCGSAYSDKPCPEARQLNRIDDARDERQRAAALAVAAREAALADQMSRDRLQQQRALASAPASEGRLSRSPPRRPVFSRSTTSTLTTPSQTAAGPRKATLNAVHRNSSFDNDGDFVAVVPKPPKQSATK